MNRNTSIGHYNILRPLGKGGMGEVYLAHDTKLDRQVAIKVLPDAVRQDTERLARFRREARAAASLKHNNIATIYALEEVDDVLFIVMEYVDGQTLADIIPSDGLDVGGPKADGRTQGSPLHFFDVFIPLADALTHAHQQGRVHRDLKPGNIMVAQDGTPKILDFGLARIMPVAEEPEQANQLGSQDETLSLNADQLNKPIKPPSDPSAMSPGPKLMGTPSYMSPEQAESEPLDHRTDIFSFGVVMYEALTGRKAFEGKSRQSLLGRIINEDPEPVTAIKPVTPYQLWLAIDRCLRKERTARTQTAYELYNDLKGVQKDVQAGTVLVDATHSVNPSIRQSVNLLRPINAIAIALLLATITATLAWFLKPSPDPERLLRRFNLPLDATVNVFEGPVLSPDGRMVVYMKGSGDNRRLWVRDLDQTEPRELSTTGGGGRPFFSPDSRHIGYFENTGSLESATLRTVSTEGGPTTPVCMLPESSFPRGATWAPDGRIIFSMSQDFTDPGSGSLYSVSAGGGTPELFLAPDTTAGERGIIYPLLLPDGRTLVASITLKDSVGTLVAISGSQRFSLVRHPGDVLAYPAYAPSGHLVYQRGFEGVGFVTGRVSTSVWAAGFDANDPLVAGQPSLVADMAQMPGVSSDGTLLYNSVGRPASRPSGQLAWVDRQGTIEPVGEVHEGLSEPELSPDGKRVAYSKVSQGNQDIWIYDIERDIPMRLTFEPGLEATARWSPDGRWVVFQSVRGALMDGALSNIYMKASDGSGETRLLVKGPGANWPYSWSPDGRYLIYVNSGRDSTGISPSRDLWYVPLRDEAGVVMVDGSQQVFLKTQFRERYARLSPDGRYLAYESNESGLFEVYVLPFPEGSGKRQVSSGGGTSPVWNPGGGELFYVSQGAMMTVPVETDGGFRPGRSRKLFDAPSDVNLFEFDVSRDGRRFLAILQQAEDIEERTIITIVENWAKDFEGRP